MKVYCKCCFGEREKADVENESEAGHSLIHVEYSRPHADRFLNLIKEEILDMKQMKCCQTAAFLQQSITDMNLLYAGVAVQYYDSCFSKVFDAIRQREP